MGKNDFLTPKAIANRIKSKGLQKLRWYCQMCQKQCRDENGFKCHLTSESHKRQMMVFGENPDRVIDGYSEEFESTFMEHLRRCHPSTRVAAQNVYNEFIADKHHIHMNSTRWLTLTEFVKHLGRTGQCKVDQTEKGWHIVLIKRDMEEELDEQRRSKRHKAEKVNENVVRSFLGKQAAEVLRVFVQQSSTGDKPTDIISEEEDRHRDYLEAQIARAQQSAKPEEAQIEGTELTRGPDDGQPPLLMTLPKSRIGQSVLAATKSRPTTNAFLEGGRQEPGTAHDRQPQQRQRSKQEEIMEREKASRRQQAEREAASKAAEAQRSSRKDDPWVQEGLVVKVMSRELKPHGYYKEKGVIEKVFNKYVAEIAVLKTGDILQVDQAQLETVLPAPGGSVRILKGSDKGSRAKLESIDTANFKAEVSLRSNERQWLDYEDICKISSA